MIEHIVLDWDNLDDVMWKTMVSKKDLVLRLELAEAENTLVVFTFDSNDWTNTHVPPC